MAFLFDGLRILVWLVINIVILALLVAPGLLLTYGLIKLTEWVL